MSKWNKDAKEEDVILIDTKLLAASKVEIVQELLKVHATVEIVTAEMI